MPDSTNTPNLVVPLASSYNERGVNAYANVLTSGIDQQKINSFYEPIRNQITGNQTLYLVKRPGVSKDATSIGTSGQVSYLIMTQPNSGPSDYPWLFNKAANNDIRASDGNSTNVIFNSATHFPAYCDRTSISGTDTGILQTRVDSSVSVAQRIFFASSIGSWTEITNGTFTGLVHRGKAEPMDGYLFVLDSMNRIYNSDLNSLSNWTSTSYIPKQIKQDDPHGLMRFNNLILAFGAETMEVFVNGGSPSGSPLVLQKSMYERVGLPFFPNPGVTNYYTTLENKLYFIGSPSGAFVSVGVYMYDGSAMHKISPNSIDKILANRTVASYSICNFSFYGKTAIAFALDAPTATTQRWLMYFPEWNDWFEWTSTVFTPVNNGTWFFGVGSNQHRVYNFSSITDNWLDDGTSYTMTHQFKLPKKDTAFASMLMCGVKADTARSASSLNVEFSDDDWQSYQAARSIDMTLNNKTIYRCGHYRDRGVRLTHSGNVECRIEAFMARIQ